MKKILMTGLILMLFTLTACSKTIDTSQYLNLVFSGVDSDGSVYLDFDYNSLKEEIKMGLDEDDQRLELLDDLESKLLVNLDETEMLTNDQIITVTIEGDEEYFKELKVKLKNTEIEYPVSGLTPAIYLDPWDENYFNQDNGVAIAYIGSEPFGELILQNKVSSANPISHIEYSFSQANNLENGQVIEINAEVPYEYYQEGYLIKEPTKKVLLDGYSSYISDFSDLNEEDLNKIITDSLASYEVVANDDLFLYESQSDYQYIFAKNIDGISNFKLADQVVFYFSQDPSLTSYYGNNLLIIPFSEDLDIKASYFKKAQTIEGITNYIIVSELIRELDGTLSYNLTPVTNNFYQDYDLMDEMYLTLFAEGYSKNILDVNLNNK